MKADNKKNNDYTDNVNKDNVNKDSVNTDSVKGNNLGDKKKKQKFKMPKIHMSKAKTKKLAREVLISLGYLAIFAGIGIFLAFNSVYGNPDKTVSQIYENYAESNWVVLFDMSDTKESTLVNSAVFANVMNNKYLYVDNGTIKQTDVEKNSDTTIINTTYVKDEETLKDSLKLIKSDEKQYLFFSVWKLDLSSLIIHDVNVKVPYGFETTIDGIDISNFDRTYIPEENMMVYHIDTIFAGTHALNCKMGGMQDVSEYIELYKDGAEYNVDPSVVLMEEVIYNGAPEIVFGLYQDGFEGVGVDNLLEYFNEEGQAKLKDIYTELYGDINQEDGAFLKIIENVEYDVSLQNAIVDTSVDAVVHFKCTYWAKTPRTSYSGIRKDYEDQAEDSVVIHYVKTDAGYIASGMDFKCIDYRQD